MVIPEVFEEITGIIKKYELKIKGNLSIFVYTKGGDTICTIPYGKKCAEFSKAILADKDHSSLVGELNRGFRKLGYETNLNSGGSKEI